MITEYNAPNKVSFLQTELGSYKVMALDTISTTQSSDHDIDPAILAPKKEVIKHFIDQMMANLQCLGEEVDPNILLLPGFCRLHKTSHSEFECSSCQEVVAKVLTQMMKAKKESILQQDPTENQSPASDSPTTLHPIEEEVEDLNASYSDTSSDGGGLSSPPPGIIKVQRRRRYIKGKGWTSIVTHPFPKVEEIK